MTASTKDWISHCEVPHNMHEVSQEYHDMLHDDKFLALNAIIILFFMVTFMIMMGIYMPSGIESQYMPKSPLQYGYY
ncbi:hypothetical protein PQO03_06415 [Lentisphaera profundi]|uniref:Uncharacterized protein n=1 Tax=Lentisphaera profundi TaxID=1658616 RepID=A0ABY7VR68_9BACT|nr:hypothetical protein [Lentisphaera profundi]WDE95351.1 hypothetical protein PQO03_06415 [Lentisphaera profundi]